MPAAYAHYRFGREALPRLPKQAAELIRRHRALFELGLQGPDFLFYCNPFFANRLRELGSAIHRRRGREFFAQAAARLKGGQAAEAYLFGLLGHYALDSQCHPLINGADTPDHTHTQLEAELDRHLLERDGKPYHENFFRYFRMKENWDGGMVARFYPEVTPLQVRMGFFNMDWMGTFLSAPEGLRRRFLDSGVLGGSIRDHMLRTGVDPRCAPLIPSIMERYADAEKLYPLLAEKLWNHIHRGQTLGDLFDQEFG